MKEENAHLVVGADGLIGRALVEHLTRAGESVFETTRRSDTVSDRRGFLDLAADVSAWRPPRGISVAYLCAAVAALDRCRREPAESAMVNVRHTVALAKKLVAGGAFVVFPSTNLVYDGSIPFRKAEDPVCPRTEYGRQKAEAEKQLLALGELISIVRFTKVLSDRTSLFRSWIQALRNGETIRPVSDMVIAPVPVSFAARVLHRVAEARLPGVVQVSGTQDISYAEAARFGARLLGVNPTLVQPIKAREANRYIEHLPAHTTLNTERLGRALALKTRNVWNTLEAAFLYPRRVAESCLEQR